MAEGPNQTFFLTRAPAGGSSPALGAWQPGEPLDNRAAAAAAASVNTRPVLLGASDTLQIECCFNTERAEGGGGGVTGTGSEEAFVEFGLSNGEEMCGVLMAVAGSDEGRAKALELDTERVQIKPVLALHREAREARLAKLRREGKGQV